LHDLALLIGENKTLNLKHITSLKLLQDIMLSITKSIFVQETVHDLKPEVAWQNDPFSAEMYRNLCRYMNNFLGSHS
jgi:hypothetical protein